MASASFGTSACTVGACTCRTGWEGYSTWSKWCWTLSKDSDSPHHFSVDLSIWDKFDTLVQKQPMVRNCSKLLPAKPPFQQVEKSCKDLQLATPEFAHWDTYRKIKQRVDSGLLWDVFKRAAHPFSKSGQKKHFQCWRHERYLSMHPLLSLDRCAHLKVSFLNPIERLWKTHATSVSRCLYCRKFHWYMQFGSKMLICQRNIWTLFNWIT